METLFKAQYKYGNLIYVVSIEKDFGDVDWEKEEDIFGIRYFVRYVEETSSGGVRIGGFELLEAALDWVFVSFGDLQWTMPDGKLVSGSSTDLAALWSEKHSDNLVK